MSSIQDIANAAYRIRESADNVQRRTALSADALKRHSAQLRQVTRGSKSGADAAQQVDAAEREVRQCAAQLLTLRGDIDRFIREVTK